MHTPRRAGWGQRRAGPDRDEPAVAWGAPASSPSILMRRKDQHEAARHGFRSSPSGGWYAKQKKHVQLGGAGTTMKHVRDFRSGDAPLRRPAAAQSRQSAARERREWKTHHEQSARQFERGLRAGASPPRRCSRSPPRRGVSIRRANAEAEWRSGSPSFLERLDAEQLGGTRRRLSRPTRSVRELELVDGSGRFSPRSRGRRSVSPRRSRSRSRSPLRARPALSARSRTVRELSPRLSLSPSPRRSLSPRRRAASPTRSRLYASDVSLGRGSRSLDVSVSRAGRGYYDDPAEELPCVAVPETSEVVFEGSWSRRSTGRVEAADPMLELQILQFDEQGEQIDGSVSDREHLRTEWKDAGTSDEEGWHVTATHSGDLHNDDGSWQTITINLSQAAVNVHSIFLVAGTRGKSRLSELDPKQLELSMQSNGRARPLPFELPGAAVSRNADTAVIGRLVRTTTSAFDSLRTGSRSWGFQPLALEVRRWNPPAGATTAQDTLSRRITRAADAIEAFLEEQKVLVVSPRTGRSYPVLQPYDIFQFNGRHLLRLVYVHCNCLGDRQSH
eukprot:COSAG04_NODE_879_length_9676_cov_154.321499_1_plen_559_part_10